MDPVQTSYKKGVFIMNAQTTNSIIDMSALTATIEKNVATIAAQAAEKEKIIKVGKAIRAFAQEEKNKLNLLQKVGNEQVSAIQAGIAKSVKDSRQAIETKCRQDLIEAGVINPDSYKLDDVIGALDNVASKGFGIFGKALKGASDAFNYAKEKTIAGMKS